MAYLGFIIATFFYISIWILFMLYLVSAFFKKHTFANSILTLLFLHNIFSILILIWSIVIMNGGFGIEFDLSIDYTVLLFLFIIPFVVVEIEDMQLRKEMLRLNGEKLGLYRIMLPTFMLVLFFISTGIYYFSCNTFVYLTSW